MTPANRNFCETDVAVLLCELVVFVTAGVERRKR